MDLIISSRDCSSQTRSWESANPATTRDPSRGISTQFKLHGHHSGLSQVKEIQPKKDAGGTAMEKCLLFSGMQESKHADGQGVGIHRMLLLSNQLDSLASLHQTQKLLLVRSGVARTRERGQPAELLQPSHVRPPVQQRAEYRQNG